MGKDSYDEWFYDPLPKCPICRQREQADRRARLYAEHLSHAAVLADGLELPPFTKQLLDIFIQVNDGNLKGYELSKTLFDVGIEVALHTMP